MRARMWIVSVGVAAMLALTALAGAANEPDTKAELAALEKKLAELHASMPAYGRQTGRSEDSGAKRREVYVQIQEVTAQMTRLMLGPEDGAKYDEYKRRQTELSQQFRNIYTDRSLDAEVRKARLADLRKQQTALSSEYGDVAKKAQTVMSGIYRRRSRTQRLAKLKPLLKVTDAEWTVLEPRLREALRLQDELRQVSWRARPSRFAAGAGRLWRGRTPSTPEGALAAVVKKDGATTGEIQTKINALRKARQQKATEIADLEKKVETAQKALRELLTVRQEAVLIVEAILD